MLDEGVYALVNEIGDAENISKSYVSRILRLALLAPDIVEAILEGRADQALIEGGTSFPVTLQVETCWLARGGPKRRALGEIGCCAKRSAEPRQLPRGQSHERRFADRLGGR
jgi:hypothetical protein